MYNRSEIMKRAWEIIRRTHTPMSFSIEMRNNRANTLSHGLRCAWAEARNVEHIRALPAEARDASLNIIERELARIPYLPFGINASQRRRQLETKRDYLLAA